MEFSETFPFSGPAPAFSPDGQLLAIVCDYRVVVREVESLNVVALFACLDKISQVEWACNSTYLMCAMHKRGALQVWSTEDPEWTCKIDEGPAGLAGARWSPDGLNLITVADFNVRLTIWSLLDASSSHVKGPKYADRGLAFSPDGDTMVVLERRDCKDFLTFLSCADWKQLRSFQIDTVDAADLAWNPRGDCLVVWDTPLVYKLRAYSSDGQCLASYSAYSDALGIRGVSWAPSGDFLAVSSFDEVTRMLNAASWRPLAECDHPDTLISIPGVLAYKELETGIGGSRAKYCLCQLPISFPMVPTDETPDINPKAYEREAPTQLWDHEGRYLLTLSLALPYTAWIWDMSQLQLVAVLQQTHTIKAASWSPHTSSLVLCTGTSRAYIWSPAGASVVQLPDEDFRAQGVHWNKNGQSFTLTDRESFCCTYIVDGQGS